MSKLPVVSGREVRRAFERAGRPPESAGDGRLIDCTHQPRPVMTGSARLTVILRRGGTNPAYPVDAPYAPIPAGGGQRAR